MFGIEEVTFHELHFLEQVQLRMQASSDVRKGRFQQEILKRMEANSEESLTFVSSPFAVYEAQRYAEKRDRYLGKKKHFFRILDESLNTKLSVATFRSMLFSYEEVIGQLETDINIEIMRINDSLENLQRQKNRYDKMTQLHMSQLCINKAEKLRNEYYGRNVKKYLALKKLLNKKLSKFAVAEAYLTEVKRRTLIRLGYYYYRASNKDTSLRHFDMTEEQLSLVNDLRVMEEFHEEMEATAKKIAKIDADIAELSSWKS